MKHLSQSRGVRHPHRITKSRYAYLDEIHTRFSSRNGEIRKRLDEFTAVPPDMYFYELLYCLLTPQSSAVNAGKVVEALQRADFFRSTADATSILNDRRHYIRFHNTKARHLDLARTHFPGIAAALSNGSAPQQLREWLVKNVKGLGWKEASHFLRNIGHRDLAILDRHILRNLKRHGAIRAIPKTLTPRRYLSIERKFRRFAASVGITMDELDLLFWSRETGEILK